VSGEVNQRLRELPSVDQVLSRLDARCPREVLANETRRVIDEARRRAKQGEPVDVAAIPARILSELKRLEMPSLRRVINATGVVLHTNLGRAPLAEGAPTTGYSNLEYDLTTGKRGRRDAHIGNLLERLTGFPGIVVNNNAAAVWLVLNELAAGGEVVVSRGELIEIGDGFRIPDIMARSGATLREVGTTNRTRIEDYRDAVNERTRLILRVHPSNFHVTGFTSKPTLAELAQLARERSIPLYEDLGSGCLVDLRPWGVEEPVVADSLRAGVHVVSFSGDKLLGGPQAGVIAGDATLVARCRRNPMFRALRCDKLVYGALETALRHTLFCHWERLPALHMISLSGDQIRSRAEALAQRFGDAEVIPGTSVIGGGSTPDQALPTWLIALQGSAAELEKRLRAGEPPVIARIENDRLLLDLRTVFEEEEDALVAAVRAARDVQAPSRGSGD
jgi:L-seryl-tRNA(Ser) seleniumtransferase